MRLHLHKITATLALVLAPLACDGTIGNALSAQPSAGSSSGGVSGGHPDVTSVALHPVPAGLRPLTVSQYQDTISDLLGDVTLPPIEAETGSVAASLSGFSPLLVEQLETAALGAAQQVFDSPARRQALVGCAPSGAADDPCARQFLARFARRAWRRAPTADELNRYGDFVGKTSVATGDALGALGYAVAAVLQSPSFLYRVELGEPAAQGFRYTSQEMAARLSYFLWNSGPDDELLVAGESGGLVTDDGLSSAVHRALLDARAHRGVSRWFADWLELEGLGSLDKDRTALPLMSDTLGAAMKNEIVLFAEDAVFAHPADAHQLFVGRTTFVNAELARLYGVAGVSGTDFSQVTWPDDGPRTGILGWGGILALHAKPKKTFPTSRGKFIRMSLLCQSIPPPPPNVNTMLDFAAPGEVLTARQRLERHRANPSCAACHALTDPLGLALEHFDAIGAYRRDDDGLPIDTTGELDGAPFKDARELGAKVAAHPDAMGCVVRQLFRFASGHVDTDGERVAMDALAAKFESSRYRIADALKEVALSDAFRLATP